MDGLCGTYGGKEEGMLGFWCGNRKERDHLNSLLMQTLIWSTTTAWQNVNFRNVRAAGK
jgi:hypothetical protein